MKRPVFLLNFVYSWNYSVI